MKKSYDIRKILLLPAALLLWSCTADELTFPAGNSQAEAPYVVIRIALPSSEYLTRSNPMGGEEGNGREKAIPNEDKIHDINVFFYNDAEDLTDGITGLDGKDDSPILHHIYFNLDDFDDKANSPLSPKTETSPYIDKYLELTFNTTEALTGITEGTNFAIIANIGEIKKGTVSTLSDLRNLDLSTYHSYDAATTDRFLMSTAFNKEYHYGDISTGTNRLTSKRNDSFTGSTTIERLAARIDLWYNAADNAGISKESAAGTPVNTLTYPVETSGDGDTKGNDKVVITNVIPVNIMQSPSFLFKKVTAKLTGWEKNDLASSNLFSWAGKEMPDGVPTSFPGDLPLNYVIERHTLDKLPITDSGTPDTSDLSEWYGNTALSNVKETITGGTEGRLSDYFTMMVENGDNDPDYKCDRVSVIAYADENTHPTDCFRSEYLTGLAFRALYIPAVIYTGYEPSDPDNETNPSPMTDAEKADLITGLSGSSGDSGQSEKETLIWRYSSSTSPKDLYFTKKEDAEAYLSNHPGDYALITEYKAGAIGDEAGIRCYYNLWIRHYNNETADPQADYPMEYAIVRNNIYRVALLSFTGPGTPEPEMREPDTMMSRIFVRKWNRRVESTPLTF